jgi:small subunit ribosomal protein S14
MAKKSKIAANERRKKTVENYADRRSELKENLRLAHNDAERRSAV